MGTYHTMNCVCAAIENINQLQNEVEEQCTLSCYSNLLNPVKSLGDTIPFLLFTKKGALFNAFGDIGGNCFNTVFFRIEHVRDCCVTLRLLRALDCTGQIVDFNEHNDICTVDELVKTINCIEVDLSCFCAIQCLSPKLLSDVIV